jgi:hypothetical protein
MNNLPFCTICGKETNKETNNVRKYRYKISSFYGYVGSKHICDDCYLKTKIRCKDCKMIKSLSECHPLGFVCKGCELSVKCNAKLINIVIDNNNKYDSKLDKQTVHKKIDNEKKQMFDIYLTDNIITIAEDNPCDYVEETYEYNKKYDLFTRKEKKIDVTPDNHGTTKYTFYEFVKIISLHDSEFNLILM